MIERAHVLLDMMIGRLIDLARPDAAVMVVSPNGVLRLPTGALRGQPRGILIATGPDFAPIRSCRARTLSTSRRPFSPVTG